MAEDVQRIVQQLLHITKLTQGGLGKKVDVAQSTIHKWLVGDHSPNLDQWRNVIKFARQSPKTRHLVETVEDVIADLDLDDRELALDVLRAHVAALRKKKTSAAKR